MAPSLPSEVWREIFHRLPCKSLVKCMSVCKDWKSLITDNSFLFAYLSYHAEANNGDDPLFIQFQRLPKYDKWFKHGDRFKQFLSVYSDNNEACYLSVLKLSLRHQHKSEMVVAGTCNGLVCIANYSELLEYSLVIIMNLSIRKYIVFPQPNVTSTSFDQRGRVGENTLIGFGFDSRNKDFKVVRLVGEQCPPKVDVYSLASGEWRSIIIDRVSSLYYCSHGKSKRLIFANDALHWIVCAKCDGRGRSFISMFDLVEETVGEMMLPKCRDESSFEISLLARGSSLAVVSEKYSGPYIVKFNIWVMKKYGDADSWNRVFSFDSRHYPGIEGVERVIALRSCGKVVLQTHGNKKILLGSREDSVKDLGLGKYVVGFAGDHHVESLFLINHGNNNDVYEDIVCVRFV